MIWIQGGPFYEISFLIYNSEEKVELLRTILIKLKNDQTFEIQNSKSQIDTKIINYNVGDLDGEIVRRNFDINLIIHISGKRKSLLNITELSMELVKLNFWFYGSIYDAKELNQLGIRPEDKSAFKDFFNSVRMKLNPILGTIAYEADCEELFAKGILSPHSYFSIQNLNLEIINRRLNQNVNEYEYFWASKGVFENNEEVEMQLETRYS